MSPVALRKYDFFEVFILLPAFSLLSLSSFPRGVCQGACLVLAAFLRHLVSPGCLYLEEKRSKADWKHGALSGRGVQSFSVSVPHWKKSFIGHTLNTL